MQLESQVREAGYAVGWVGEAARAGERGKGKVFENEERIEKEGERWGRNKRRQEERETGFAIRTSDAMDYFLNSI